MARLTIRGKSRYIKRMSKHLKHEHPSTKHRMTVQGIKKHHEREERGERKEHKHHHHPKKRKHSGNIWHELAIRPFDR